MYRDVNGKEIVKGDKVQLYHLRGKKNATIANKGKIKTIRVLDVYSGLNAAYFEEGGGCHFCDAMSRVEIASSNE